jgi:hypothetical protein
MSTNVRRRDILKLLSVGGVVFASGLGLAGCAESAAAGAVPSGAPLPPLPLAPARQEDFFFLQLSDTQASGLIGDAQIEWLERDLAALPREAPIVILTHRPLFDLYPQWDWTTKDGARAIEVLAKRPNVTVFYGHIHQEHHQMTGAIAHHSARSLIFPMPAPGAAPKRAPLPWDPNSSDHGLGHRAVKVASGKPQASEIPFRRG